ncbi:MAG: superinfection immunity protein [Nocardioides sp.]|uniref:superinfection immunity protein n=1 Tax=Nocardioides sp. TaxID=35761 RepID=UPI0023A4D911|nr:superinfection immunity protein [Nocardioides sp.]MDE0778289.1 superinfection immunity protein [Nocardioides sp.]
MLPWGVAATRRTSNAGAVALVSFFLGWTIIGWFVALIMALMGRAATPQWVYRR